MSAFHDYLQNRRRHIENSLEQHLPPLAPHLRLHEAMHYAVLTGGKRLRPLLVYLTGEALAVNTEHLDLPACAVELIHAYSLVHDDLPAMDNDDLRRGKPTCHKAFDEATAILVGDALQSLAFELLAKTSQFLSPAQGIQMIVTLASASGVHGMAGGQALDLAAEGGSLDRVNIEQLYHLKTGALIQASVEMALIAATQANSEEKSALRHYAKYLGLAFQIQDDIADIEGDVSSLGKTPGNDLKHQKPTYAAVMGLTQAKAEVKTLQQKAKDALNYLDARANHLQQLTDEILSLSC